MTTNHNLNGIHILNQFIWAELKSGGFMPDETSYQGLVPIIPTQQVAVFNDMPTNLPFIVYDYIIASYDIDLWANVEQVTYRIYSDNESQLRTVTNFLVDLCKRWDWTAGELNDWVREGSRDSHKKFDFKYVQVIGGTSPAPFEQEGGRQDSSLTVRVAYTHDENLTVGKGKGMRA